MLRTGCAAASRGPRRRILAVERNNPVHLAWQGSFGATGDRPTANGEDREEVTFVDCTAFGKQAEVINKDILEGNKVGVTGTPALYINGMPYRQDTSFEALSKVIDAEIQRKTAGK